MARFRSHLAFAGCVLLLLAAVVSPARAQSDLFLYAPGNIGTSAFTTNAGSTPTSITTIGAGASRQGFGSVVRGDQAFAYVGYNGSSPSIQVINTATQSVVQTVAAAGRPQFMVSSPNGSTLYVANDPGNNVLVYSVGATTGLLTQTSTITIDAPRGLAISPDGATLYVANRISNSVSVVNTATNTITATVGVGTEPFSIAINPAGTLVYVGDIAGASVSVINTATNTVATTFSNGGTPAGIVLSPDGQYLYVTVTNLNQVRVYDTSSNALIGTFASGSSPIGLAISPDGSTLYVMNGGSNNGQAFSINASSGLLTTLGSFSTTPGAALFGLCGNGSSANGMLGSGGTFFATSTGALGCAGSSATISGGTIVAGVNNLVMPTPIVLASQGGTVDTNGNNLTLGGAISGVGGLTKNGLGILTLSGSSTYNGATNVNVGTLQAGATNAFSPFSAFTVASGAVLDLNNFNQTIGSLAGAGSVTLGSATLTTGNDNTSTTFSGGISGSGGLTKIGGGIFVLNGDNTYTGVTTISAGALVLGDGGANGSIVGDVTNNAIFAINRSDTYTFGGVISGTGTFGQIGSGTTIVTGVSTYTGRTAIDAGTLQAGAANVFASASAFTVALGATLDLNNFNQTIGSLAGAGSVTLGSATLTTGNDNTSTTFSGGISGTGGLTKIGSGIFTLSGSGNYTGATNVNAGTLQAGATNAFASSSAFTVASGATLDLNNFNQTIGSLAGAGNVTLGSATLTTNGNDMSTVYSGVISGSGGLVKTGSAILTLLGANTYTGGTTVADGALEIGDASHTAAIVGAVNNNGVLLFMNADTSAITTITNTNTAAFLNSTTAGNAIINNSAFLNFSDASSAGNARITNNGNLGFGDTATAANSVIVNNGVMGFAGASTAGNATIVTNNGGLTGFAEDSRGGNARLITNAGGAVDISPLTKAGVAVGSIEGAGSYFLGSKQFTVGGNNLSTEVSGAIKDGGFLGGIGGSLVKTGTGTLLLSGASSYTGATTVNAGTLIVNGSIASSAVTVNAGALLAGTGTVGATTIASGGTFAPGNSPGTMTVNGNLAFQSGAVYLVQVNPSTASSANVTAGGSASLAGTVQAAFAAGSYLTRNYTIVSAAGGVSGAFNALSTSNLPAGFTANLSYTANSAILNLTATLGQPPAPTAPTGPTGPSALGATGLSGNQLNVANSLNGFFNNGGALPPAFVSVFGLTGGNLGNALSQLSGEAATGAQQVGFQLTNQFLGLMLDPFVDGRSGAGGTDHPALGFAPEQETMPPQIALAYASVSKAPPKPAPVVYEPRWTVWGAGFGGSNRTSGDIAVTGSHDLAATTAGFAGGFDYHLSRDSVVGLAFAGGGTNWSVSQGLGGGKSDAFQAGVYGATKYGPAYLAAAFAFANHWMSTDRLAFAGDHLTASFNAQSYGGRLEGGYRFATVYAGITPYAAIQAQNFHTPGYSEGGVIANGFALGFNGRDATDTRSELGARFDRALAVYTNAVLALRARVAWAHDWISDPSLTPLFQTLPGASFVVNGATPAKDSVLTSAGAEYRLANGVTLLAKFDGEFASHSSTYAGTGTLRYAW